MADENKQDENKQEEIFKIKIYFEPKIRWKIYKALKNLMQYAIVEGQNWIFLLSEKDIDNELKEYAYKIEKTKYVFEREENWTSMQII